MLSKITKRLVDTMEPSKRDMFVWDSELTGFGLKTTPKGRKVYIVQYRMGGGSTRRHTIGAHGSPWTPASARIEAIKLLGLIASGIDPAEQRRDARKDITLNELCEQYLAEGTHAKKRSTIAMDRSRIEAHIRPKLGRKRLKQLRKSDISKWMSAVATGETARDKKTGPRGRSIVKGGPGAANRTLGMLGAVLEYGVENGLLATNPARGVKKFKEGRPMRFLSSSEIARLGDALRLAEASGANPVALAAIRLLLLTGCRKNEALSLKWKEVDFDGGFLRLEDSKTGVKAVPIGAPAMKILAELSATKKGEYVFPGKDQDSHLVGLQKVWEKVRQSADLNDVRLHDLRHSFASVGARSGESLLVIGKVLGHANASTTGRYAHLSDDPIRRASESISQQIEHSLRVNE